MDMQVPQPAPPRVILSPDGLWRWDGEAWVPTTPRAGRIYRPMGSLARLAVVGLAIAGVAEAVLIGALAGRLDIVNRYIEGSTVSLADARHSDDTVRVAAGVHLGAFVLCAILFLAWLHRVVANNHALGARALRFSPGGAVGWWFAPLINFVYPFRIVVESWRAADPRQPHSTADQRSATRVPVMLSGWWLAFIVGSLMSRIAGAVYISGPDDLHGLHTDTVLTMVSLALLVVAAVLGALVVLELTGRQRAQRAVVSVIL